MSPTRIRDAIKAEPFVPFQLVLTNGLRYTIEHSDFIAVSPGEFARDLVFWTEFGPHRGEFQTHWISIRQIVELITFVESSQHGAQAEGNGI